MASVGGIFLVMLCGCSNNAPVAPVNGSVTYQSKPVSSGRVLFLPKGGGKQGLGTIQSNG